MITILKRTFTLSGLAMVTTAFGRAVFADATPKIDGTWLMDVRTVCAVGGVVLFGAWYIGRWMKGIDDQMTQASERFDRIEENMAQRDRLLTDISGRMDQDKQARSDKTGI